jgi:ATP-dependent Clp endopeptidase proteolytic subunit ClpP
MNQNENMEEELSSNQVNDYHALLDACSAEFELGIDIADKVIYLSGEITEYSLEKVMKQINILRKFHTEIDYITMYINSYGGEAYDAIGIIDYIETLPFKVNAVCYGKAMSAGALILISVTGERTISKNASLMLHEILSDSSGTSSQTRVHTKHINKLGSIIITLLEKKSLKSRKFWKKKLLPDLYLTAHDALKIGLIDKII